MVSSEFFGWMIVGLALIFITSLVLVSSRIISRIARRANRSLREILKERRGGR
ncbi:MAG: hypothetical protein JSV25_06405 [Spirochaetota bacterium]|nr:MAG: hypothetical protein JSV25_06405 [Spirochaetota bacterium]